MSKLIACPHCKMLVHVILEEAGGKQRGFARARLKTLERIKAECTPAIHAEKAKTIRYCNVCHKTILWDGATTKRGV